MKKELNALAAVKTAIFVQRYNGARPEQTLAEGGNGE